MEELLKRLEIIRSGIAIDDSEIIELQMIKLKKMTLDSEVLDIINQLKNSDYIEALNNINKYLQKYSGVVKYVDKELQALKMRLKTLENKYQELYSIKTEYLNNIEEFNIMYNLKLGDIIEEILRLKEQLLRKKQEKYKQNKNTINEIDNMLKEINATLDELDKIFKDEELNKVYEELKKQKEELKKQKEKLEEETNEFDTQNLEEEYKEAKKAYEEFNYEYQKIKDEFKNSQKLSEKEKKELKTLWRKACKLCHPDIVSDELKEQAKKIMQELNEAYSKNDITKIKEILHNLENNKAFELSSDSIDDKELLKQKIQELENSLAELEVEIEEIKKDETFQTIEKIDDWDEYFDDLREKLLKEYDELIALIEEQDDNIKQENNLIKEEVSQYTKNIKEIVNINFEKIRRYCNNLASNNEADTMQEYLANTGKKYKAFIYDMMENLVDMIDGQTIDIIDWGCGQGIGAMLVLNYIYEKQLDVVIEQVVLVDNDREKISRAMAQCEALNFYDAKIVGLDDMQEVKSKNFSLNLIVNDKLPLNLIEKNFDIINGSCFVMISEDEDIIKDYNDKLESILENQDIIIEQNKKVGRFVKYEKIFGVR